MRDATLLAGYKVAAVMLPSLVLFLVILLARVPIQNSEALDGDKSS